MNRPTLFACAVLILTQWTVAAAEDFPRSLLGFIVPNGNNAVGSGVRTRLELEMSCFAGVCAAW